MSEPTAYIMTPGTGPSKVGETAIAQCSRCLQTCYGHKGAYDEYRALQPTGPIICLECAIPEMRRMAREGNPPDIGVLPATQDVLGQDACDEGTRMLRSLFADSMYETYDEEKYGYMQREELDDDGLNWGRR